MKKTIIVLIVSALFMACSKNSSDLESKRNELKDKKKTFAQLKSQIEKLEKEIALLDTSRRDEGIPVMVETVKSGMFKNPFTFQGLVASDKNVLINPEVPGTVTQIHVVEGQRVYKGQALVSLDGSAVQSRITELETSLNLARIQFERQKSLWDQKIGSEIQFLQAKNNYEGLQKALATAQIQLGKYTLRSPINGSVDEIFANEGQLVTGMGGLGVMRVVNLNDVEIKANVSEAYLTTLQPGQDVEVYYPSLQLKVREKISSIGDVINADNRTFTVIIKPRNGSGQLKPNLLALITASDYVKSDAIAVPTRLIRNDGKGNYILVVSADQRVEKRKLVIEKQFANESLIQSGLRVGDQIITEGFNSVVAGDPVKIVSSK